MGDELNATATPVSWSYDAAWRRDVGRPLNGAQHDVANASLTVQSASDGPLIYHYYALLELIKLYHQVIYGTSHQAFEQLWRNQE